MAGRHNKRENTRPAPGTRWRRQRAQAGTEDADNRGTWTIVSWHKATQFDYALLRQHPLDDIAVAEETLRRLYKQVR